MGVLHLWEILSCTGDQGKRISELSGKVVAVDLSMWILEFRKCEGTRHLYNLYLRNLFYRTLEFMKDGIQLIFVLDGLAPEIKHDKLKKQRENIKFEMDLDPDTANRPYLERYSMECVKLIECLGLPWINSPGEAEEMCAYLEKKRIVDGCITKDSDFFCYGGQTIYRNLRRECKLYVFDQFKMDNIESKLGYHQSDLVAMALLLGCDYNHGGIKNVGKDKAVTLIKTWKEKGIDPLKRILGWQENKELDDVELKTKSRSHKDPHCKKCGHKGNTQSHQRAGCTICKTDADCNGSCDILCGCDWHREDQLIQKHKLEVTVRQRSRETTDFSHRSNKVVDEYMKPDLGIDLNKDDIVWRPVDMKALVDYLDCKLYMPQAKVIEVITPVFIVSQLYQNGDDFMFTPVRIERQCKHCGVLGYLVSWDKTDRNTWPMASSVEVKVEKKLFTKSFPGLVTEFEKRTASKAPAVKRKENMTSGKDDTTPQKKTASTKGSQNKNQSFVDDKKNLQKQKFPSVTQIFTSQPSSDQKSVDKQTPSSVSQSVFGQSSFGHTSVSQSSIEGSTQAQTSVKKQTVDKPSVSQPSVCQPSVSLTSISQPSVSYQTVGIKRQLNFSITPPATAKKLHTDHNDKFLSDIKTERQTVTVKQGVQNKEILKGLIKDEVKREWNTTPYEAKGSLHEILDSAEPVIDLTEDETDEEQEDHANSHTANVTGSMKYPDLTVKNNKIVAGNGGGIKSIDELGSFTYQNLVNENRKMAASRGVATVGNTVEDKSQVRDMFGVSQGEVVTLGNTVKDRSKVRKMFGVSQTGLVTLGNTVKDRSKVREMFGVSQSGLVTVGNTVKDRSKVGEMVGVSQSGLVTVGNTVKDRSKVRKMFGVSQSGLVTVGNTVKDRSKVGEMFSVSQGGLVTVGNTVKDRSKVRKMFGVSQGGLVTVGNTVKDRSKVGEMFSVSQGGLVTVGNTVKDRSKVGEMFSVSQGGLVTVGNTVKDRSKVGEMFSVSQGGLVTVGNTVKDRSKVGEMFSASQSESGLVTFQDQSEFEKLDLRLENRNDFELVEISEEELNLSLT